MLTLREYQAVTQNEMQPLSTGPTIRDASRERRPVNNVFEKYKTRWVYDGSQQKRTNATADTRWIRNTFAPTVRHSTHKLLCAMATSSRTFRWRRSMCRDRLHDFKSLERATAPELST